SSSTTPKALTSNSTTTASPTATPKKTGCHQPNQPVYSTSSTRRPKSSSTAKLSVRKTLYSFTAAHHCSHSAPAISPSAISSYPLRANAPTLNSASYSTARVD